MFCDCRKSFPGNLSLHRRDLSNLAKTFEEAVAREERDVGRGRRHSLDIRYHSGSLGGGIHLLSPHQKLCDINSKWYSRIQQISWLVFYVCADCYPAKFALIDNEACWYVRPFVWVCKGRSMILDARWYTARRYESCLRPLWDHESVSRAELQEDAESTKKGTTK